MTISGTSSRIGYSVNEDVSITTGIRTVTNIGISHVDINLFTFKAGINYILSGTPDNGSSQSRLSFVGCTYGHYLKQLIISIEKE